MRCPSCNRVMFVRGQCRRCTKAATRFALGGRLKSADPADLAVGGLAAPDGLAGAAMVGVALAVSEPAKADPPSGGGDFGGGGASSSWSGGSDSGGV